MHSAVLERWSRGNTAIHRRDPRVKLAALLTFLIVLGTAHQALPWLALGLSLLLAIILVSARIPLAGALTRAAIVLPFTLCFAAISWASGDPARAVSLVLKSYLSTLAVLAVVSTTPFPLILRALELTGIPRFLLMVTQFLYRYLFVISQEASQMSQAAASRGGRVTGFSGGNIRFKAAAGALSVLFSRSYSRAEEIHRAMLARGFSGRLPTLHTLSLGPLDACFAAVACSAPILLRIAVERLAA